MQISMFQGAVARMRPALIALAFLTLGVSGMTPAWAEKITDMAGREVELPAKVERILLGEGRLFNALALLEGKEDPFARLAGWQGDYRELDAQAYARYQAKFPHADAVPLIGKTNENTISAEKVLELKPDIAVFSIGGGHGPQVGNPLVDLLEKVGVPVVFLDFRMDPVKNTVPSMRLLGKAIQREDKAEEFIAFYESAMQRVQEGVSKVAPNDRPSVFLDVRGGSLPDLSTAGSVGLGQFVELAGGNNVGSSLLERSMGAVNIEHVLATDPKFYVLTGSGAANRAGLQLGAGTDAAAAVATLQKTAARQALHNLPAVADGNVYGIWHHFYVAPSHVVLIQAMAKWFHPEQFADLDPQQTWHDMHDKFLAIEPGGTYWIAGPDSLAAKAEASASGSNRQAAK